MCQISVVKKMIVKTMNILNQYNNIDDLNECLIYQNNPPSPSNNPGPVPKPLGSIRKYVQQKLKQFAPLSIYFKPFRWNKPFI